MEWRGRRRAAALPGFGGGDIRRTHRSASVQRAAESTRSGGHVGEGLRHIAATHTRLAAQPRQHHRRRNQRFQRNSSNANNSTDPYVIDEPATLVMRDDRASLKLRQV